MNGLAAGQSLRARLSASMGLGAIVALSSFGQALAATTYTDPVGDALFHAPAYADIVAGTLVDDAGTFEFIVKVADVIPQTPRLTPPGVQALRWVASLDLDPTTFPIGWPLPQQLPAQATILMRLLQKMQPAACLICQHRITYLYCRQ